MKDQTPLINQSAPIEAKVTRARWRCTLLVGSAFACLAASASAGNLLVNGGFETGDLTGWLTTLATDGAVTSAEAHDGTYSMEMLAVDFIYQEFAPADKLHAKSLRFWAKGDVLAGPAYAIVYYRDGTSDQLFFGGASLSSGDWTEFFLTLKPKKVVIEALIETGETTPIYVDDVRLREFSP